jgi:hypothetical protein
MIFTFLPILRFVRRSKDTPDFVEGEDGFRFGRLLRIQIPVY